MKSYDVKFWKTKKNASSKTPSYVVRWIVAGKECSKTFRGSELAENFLSDLRQAARRGEWFDTDTGLPESMLKAKNARTWLEFAEAYVRIRWPHQAANSRASAVDALLVVTVALAAERKGRPDRDLLRRALRDHVLVPEDRRRELPAEVRTALRWLEAASLPLTDLEEPRHARAVLEALAVRLDGAAAATNTFRRRRAVFHHALEYAVELGELPGNPLDRVKWKPTKQNDVVDRRVVVNPQQACELLAGVTYVGRTRGPMLAAMFACMYFAALRPSEAIGLRRQDCILPERGWGQITVTKTRSYTTKRFTDSGESYDERGLKHRDGDEDRPVPIPPDLVAILRAHIAKFGTAPDGRLFFTGGGGAFGTEYIRIWKQARPYGLTPDQVASPLAARPYDLRHAAVSLWLNAGVHAPEVAERAGHSVDVLLRVYAKCIDGQREIANQRIQKALAE
ncbi:tyrosine-type recombinase/integrase [Actinoallomurus sp. CA-150999]|uniref:tyrosine-type recombinase/integrase n=1 Tax=Actinoallomurus sp. CA-150999 TaxID=3239887 RepID=UPI003D9307B6